MRLVILLCCAAVLATGETWLTDYQAARAEAAASKRDVLINFSGSDWCPLCVKLDHEILAKPECLQPIAARFVLLKLDDLRKTPLPAARRTELELLKKRYEIIGFPTLVLATADGAEYARVGYQEMEPAVFAQRLLAMSAGRGQEPALRAAVDAASGTARAEALGRLIAHHELMGKDVGRDLVEEAVRADPAGALPGTASLRQRLQDNDLLMALDQALQAKDGVRVRALIASGIADQRLSLGLRIRLLIQRGLALRTFDPVSARADFAMARDLGPQGEDVEQLNEMIKALDGTIARMQAAEKP